MPAAKLSISPPRVRLMVELSLLERRLAEL